jgi:CheY-like chemotaxis protein
LGSGSERQEKPAKGEAAGPLNGLTLLVVDDDADLRLYVRQCVLGAPGRIGMVIEATDGARGLEVIRAERPHVLVCDVLMPRLGGFELCKQLRADPATSRLPVLLLTGGATSNETFTRATEAGADGVLLKPFNAQRLRAAVDRVIDSRRSSD